MIHNMRHEFASQLVPIDDSVTFLHGDIHMHIYRLGLLSWGVWGDKIAWHIGLLHELSSLFRIPYRCALGEIDQHLVCVHIGQASAEVLDTRGKMMRPCHDL